MKNSTQCAFAVLASLSIAACSTSGSGEAPAPTTPAPAPTTPAPTTPAPGEVATPTALADDVVAALAYSADDNPLGVPSAATIQGADDAPVLSDTTYTVDGQTYTLIPLDGDDSTVSTGDLFAVELASVDGAKAVAAGEFGVFNDQGADVDRVDILFSATPTEVANLPASTAEYRGTFSGFLADVEDGDNADANIGTGLFTATADFGEAQSLTGAFNAQNADGSAGEQYSELTADIEGNSFVGVINNDLSNPNNTDEQISAGGYFTGDNASGLVGAGVGTFNHSDGSSEIAVIVFEGTAE